MNHWPQLLSPSARCLRPAQPSFMVSYLGLYAIQFLRDPGLIRGLWGSLFWVLWRLVEKDPCPFRGVSGGSPHKGGFGDISIYGCEGFLLTYII